VKKGKVQYFVNIMGANNLSASVLHGRIDGKMKGAVLKDAGQMTLKDGLEFELLTESH